MLIVNFGDANWNMISSINLTVKIFAVGKFAIIMKYRLEILKNTINLVFSDGTSGNQCGGCAMNPSLQGKNVGKNTKRHI